MNRVNLKIIVLPYDVARELIKGADEIHTGKNFSTAATINVNKIVDGYSILFDSYTFDRLDMDILFQSITELLKSKLIDTTVYVENQYLIHVVGGSENWYFSERTGLQLIRLANLFLENDDDDFNFLLNANMMMVRRLCEEAADGGYDIPEFSIPEEEVDIVPEDDRDESSLRRDFYRSIGESPLDDYGFTGKSKKSRKSKSKRKYSQSKVLAHAKHPKREFDRHGVVIWRDRDDRDRDEKMIKDFLKEFIPGDARWKREFRSDLLERWMEAFTIKKKKLDRLERKMKKSGKKKKKKKMSPGESIAMGLSRQIVAATSPDPWNNPNK